MDQCRAFQRSRRKSTQHLSFSGPWQTFEDDDRTDLLADEVYLVLQQADAALSIRSFENEREDVGKEAKHASKTHACAIRENVLVVLLLLSLLMLKYVANQASKQAKLHSSGREQSDRSSLPYTFPLSGIHSRHSCDTR